MSKKKKEETLAGLYILFFSAGSLHKLEGCVCSCFNKMQRCSNQHVPALYLSGNRTAQLFMGFVQ